MTPVLAALLATGAALVQAGAVTTQSQAAVPQGTPPAAAQTAGADYTFPAGAGLLIFHVDPAKAAEFDAVVGRLSEALKVASTASRQAQAASWRIFKSAEKPGETLLYLFVFDPVVEKVSYDPLLVIAESLPAELQPLFDRMKAAVVRVERMALTKVR